MRVLRSTCSALMFLAALVGSSDLARAQCPSGSGLEPNDSCGTAVWITSGVFSDAVAVGEPDNFAVTVPAGATLSVELDDGQFVTEDLEILLYDDLDCSALIETGDYHNGFQMELLWTNSSPTSRTVVYTVLTPLSLQCKSYDMQVVNAIDQAAVEAVPFCRGDGSADAGSGPVGCPCGNTAVPGSVEGCWNSLGRGATLDASGTTVVAFDTLAFTVQDAIPHQTGMLVQGMTRIAVPFKDGVLCMGYETRRLEVLFFDGAGAATTAGSIATDGNVSPGQTRHYQAWYRDPGGVSPCGTGSNFTQGLTLSWI